MRTRMGASHRALLLFRRMSTILIRCLMVRPETPLPCPLVKNKSCDTYRWLFCSVISGWRYSPDQDAEISVDVQGRPSTAIYSNGVFLSLYLLLAALLITRLQDEYLTGSGIPSACDPPDVGLSGTPRSKLSVPQSLCT